jgi:hypothetical protein
MDCLLVTTGVQVGLVKCLIEVNFRKHRFGDWVYFHPQIGQEERSLFTVSPDDSMDMSAIHAVVIQKNTLNLHRLELLSELHSVVVDLEI